MSKQSELQPIYHAQSHQQTIPRKSFNLSSLSKTTASAVYKQVPRPLLKSDSQPIWNSFWLQRLTLFAIAILFADLSAALLILWRISVSQDGFPLSLSTSHYAWTYGPIAVLVLVMGLWRQVLYYCKVTQAWQEMKQGPTSAERSLLLDYVWPTIPMTLWKSVKYRHLPVVSAIVGFLLLKLVVIISTSLLVLRPTQISEQATLQLERAFNATVPVSKLSHLPKDFSSYPEGEEYEDLTPYALNMVDPVYTSTPSSTFYKYLSILAGFGIDNNGTQDNVAFSTIREGSVVNDTTSISLVVPAAETRSTCEIAKVTLQPCDHVPTSNLCFGLDTASCRVGHLNIRNSTGQLINQTIVESYFSRVDCGDDINRPGDALPNPLTGSPFDPTIPYSYQYALISAMDLPYRQNWEGLSDQRLRILAQNVSAILCKIEYNVGSMKLTKNLLTATYSVDTKEAGLSGKLPGLTDLGFSEIIMANLYDASQFFGHSAIGDYESIAAGLLYLIRRTMNESIVASTYTYISPEELRTTAVRVLDGIGTQLMSQFFMVSNLTNVDGQVIRTEKRLHVGTLQSGAMVAGFLLMSLITLVINFTITRNAVCHDPGKLATHAAILKLSPTTQQQLMGCGALDLRQIRERLSDSMFRLNPNDEIGIDTIKGFDCSRGSQKGKHGKKTKAGRRGWIPLSARKAMVTITLVFPLLAIGVLEVLYKLSVKNHGVVNVTGDDASTSYAIRYASTVVALIIANVVNCLDSVISVFAVFSTLCSGGTPAKRSTHSHLNGHLPLLAFYTAISDKHYSAALSSAASTIGTLLPIFVSGLWACDNTHFVHSEVTALQLTKWNPPEDPYVNNGATAIFSDIQHGLAQLPASIWEDLVFPNVGEISFQSTDDSDKFAGTSARYLFTVPALRPSLTCDIMSPDQIEVINKYNESIPSWDATVRVVANVPPACGQIQPDNSTMATISLGTWVDVAWIAQLVVTDLLPGNEVDLARFSGGELNLDMTHSVNGCPSLGAVYANHTYGPLSEDEVTAIICYQQIQQIMTEVAYMRNSTGHMAVDKTQTPIPDESTVKNLTNNATGLDTFDYNIPLPLLNLLPFGTESLTETSVDRFFDYLVNGPNGTSERLLAENATQSLKYIEALYRTFMVHIIDRDFRDETTSSSLRIRDTLSAETILEGIAKGPGKPRLRTQFIPKLVLQVMLGVMTLLSGIAYMLVDLRGTLPRNPCSIASTMALLAGSEMCRAETGAEGHPEDITSLMRDWERQKFSLGWWEPNSGESQERFGIDIGTAESLGFRRRRGGRRGVGDEEHYLKLTVHETRSDAR